MGWFSQNWLWVLFGVAFVGMHLVGHGGHGGHSAGGDADEHREHAEAEHVEARPNAKSSAMTGAGPRDAARGMLNTKLATWALGIFAALTFIVCVIYGLVTPPSLHMQGFLEQVLPAFTWLTGWGFLLGLAESFLYGAYAGLVFCPIYNLLYRYWGPTVVRTK
jgi:hypothetical protein